MSGNGYTNPCPVCENDMDVYEDSKPFPTTNCWCKHCGFMSTNVVERMSLDEVNSYRREDEMERITQEEYDKYNGDFFL